MTEVLSEPTLVSYWRLSEGETGSPVAPDSAPDMPKDGQYQNAGGGGVTRSVAGALTIGSDPNDKGAEFDGVHGFMEVPHDQLLNASSEFSIEFWIRPMGDMSTPQVVVGSYEVDSNGNMVSGFVLDMLEGAERQIRVRIGNNLPAGPTALQTTLGDDFDNGGWRHVAVTYNAIDKTLNLYVNCTDGMSRASLLPDSSTPPVYYFQNKSAPLRVAAGWTEQAGPTPMVGQFFKGQIDEVALYRSALDGNTIANHFKHGISTPS